MPSEIKSASDRTGAFVHKRAFQVPAALRSDLLRPGSLSSRLQIWCDGALPVTVISQGPARPSLDEARILNLHPRQRVWVREVRLGPAGQPWVKGRTVAPLPDMRGTLQHLKHLGKKPLGSILFQGRHWHRSPFLLGTMLADSRAGDLPARRSLFYHNGSRLLVTEGFYPAYWQRLQQQRQDPLNYRVAPHPRKPLPETP